MNQPRGRWEGAVEGDAAAVALVVAAAAEMDLIRTPAAAAGVGQTTCPDAHSGQGRSRGTPHRSRPWRSGTCHRSWATHHPDTVIDHFVHRVTLRRMETRRRTTRTRDLLVKFPQPKTAKPPSSARLAEPAVALVAGPSMSDGWPLR